MRTKIIKTTRAKRRNQVDEENKMIIGPLNCANPECPWGKFLKDAIHYCCAACLGMHERQLQKDNPCLEQETP
jgi:hypothetical protein